METVSIGTARRIALGAQGFATPRPKGISDRRQIRRVLRHTQLFQIDSVNILARAHEMPSWSRIGAYRRGTLEAMLNDGELFEYWAHEASLLPAADWPLMQWRMELSRTGKAGWASVLAMEQRNPTMINNIFAAIRDNGPTTASSFNEPGRRTGPWWDWSDAKLALEFLFATGQVTARRRSNFEREYDLPERMLPPEAVNAVIPTEFEARHELLRRSAIALGIATERDLYDYYRLKSKASRPALQQLIADGVIAPVAVQGWKPVAYLHRDAVVPRTINANALLSPFDPVVWERRRALQLFDFHYRIEIYTPAPKRIYGYYVLPFLHDGRIGARVDLKADRHSSTLLVLGAWAEHHAERVAVAEALATELVELAKWLDLETITASQLGDLALPLAGELRSLSR